MKLRFLYERRESDGDKSGRGESKSGSVVLAVHSNFVVDAASAASSRWADDPGRFGPHRLRILKNYVARFKRFMSERLSGGDTIIITLMGEPYTLHNWYDEKSHLGEVDLVEMGVEQEEVYRIHEDLMGFIRRLGSNPGVYVVSEGVAGGACSEGRLDHVLGGGGELVVVGGNLSGCLRNTVEALSGRGDFSVRVVRELSFDDDSEFWARSLEF